MKMAGPKIVMVCATLATLTGCGVSKPPPLSQDISPEAKPVTLSRQAAVQQAGFGSTLWDDTNRVTEKVRIFKHHDKGPMDLTHQVAASVSSVGISLLDPTLTEDEKKEIQANANQGLWGKTADQVGTFYENALTTTALCAGPTGVAALNVWDATTGSVGALLRDTRKFVFQQPDETSGSHTLNFLWNGAKNVGSIVPDVLGGVVDLGRDTVAYFADRLPLEDSKSPQALPKPHHPPRSNMKLAAASGLSGSEQVLENSMSTPRDIIPVGVRALKPTTSPRFHAPGGPG